MQEMPRAWEMQKHGSEIMRTAENARTHRNMCKIEGAERSSVIASRGKEYRIQERGANS
jgi:hypothetical protein